ncbi:hypothetical protein [Vibrio alginolyticus]|uniref:hypothetical protein n=1 Tax=Vibrio alginolyticus TaxID=663 RepID=UPI00193C16E2|nr:hypothetical protein [Vibrio alginolyticus]
MIFSSNTPCRTKSDFIEFYTKMLNDTQDSRYDRKLNKKSLCLEREATIGRLNAIVNTLNRSRDVICLSTANSSIDNQHAIRNILGPTANFMEGSQLKNEAIRLNYVIIMIDIKIRIVTLPFLTSAHKEQGITMKTLTDKLQESYEFITPIVLHTSDELKAQADKFGRNPFD